MFGARLGDRSKAPKPQATVRSEIGSYLNMASAKIDALQDGAGLVVGLASGLQARNASASSGRTIVR